MSTKQLNQLAELLQLHPPPFIFIHDPLHSRPTPSSFLHNSLHNSTSQSMPVRIDCNACLTSKMLFHAIINEVTSWVPELNTKGRATSWFNRHVSKWDRSLDSFVEALKAAFDETIGTLGTRTNANLILLFENVERLKETLPALIVPLTRLCELAQIPISTVFISSAPWCEISPPIGTLTEPYLVSVASRSKQDTISYLNSLFPVAVAGSSTSRPNSDAYNPILKPLYSTFLGVLYDGCTPYTTDPDDLTHLAYAMWPGFVRPVLEDWWAAEQSLEGGDEKERGEDRPVSSNEEHRRKPQELRTLPPDSATPLLIRHFLVSFNSSFSPLHNRTISAKSFLNAQASQPSFRLSQRFTAPAMASINASLSSSPKKTGLGLAGSKHGDLGASLSKHKKLLLVGAYISSFNPARTDLRMFGRVAEGVMKKGRARRTGGISTGKSLFGRKAAKVPQVLLGPNSFTLERLLAIYGALVVEHGDGHTAPINLQPGQVEIEVHRTTVLTMLTELIQLRLINRIGQHDRLDNNVTLKCNVGFEVAESFAREMKFNLSDLLWDPVS
ncbi:hypothetical protein M407DRAFT_219477 [Tulasnella calospora MUT 4182]|uniref:Uncharacterized protein n=1 Tax=Tulasnella calospora MUT 4182 TaxID=1051891 RepID=A0A0C3LHW7_9AGAM|nr:hypothetical protein M407DRAFT_219477 [Tulasnella calospora MUT 4182]